MDAASSAALTEFINHSNSRIDQQQESINATGRAVQALVTQVSGLSQQLQQLHAPTAPPTPPVSPASLERRDLPEPRLPVPQSYAVNSQLEKQHRKDFDGTSKSRIRAETVFYEHSHSAVGSDELRIIINPQDYEKRVSNIYFNSLTGRASLCSIQSVSRLIGIALNPREASFIHLEGLLHKSHSDGTGSSDFAIYHTPCEGALNQRHYPPPARRRAAILTALIMLIW
ncbi:hypothetical protein DPX16_19827 [Anabarilius grahami]|uniref:Uncharacterized protein n=1 Tax=Anabarilius grahami TaxID=495550 RepID=A0A3N0Y8A9_ANAGA|nr:hypothetical protein DPX16_19827 [Anabarilius grahami]